MKVAVTGGAGFLGSHLVSELRTLGHDTETVDDISGGHLANVNGPLTILDICDNDAMERLTRAFAGCRAVVHCSAMAHEGLSVFSPSLITRNIVVGSVNVMTAAVRAGVEHVVNCSSMARYGDATTPYREDMTPKPVDPYGAAKLFAEQQMTLIGGIHGVNVVHAVPHNIYGPRQKQDDPYRNVVAIMINRMLQGKPPIIYGDGEQTRCFSWIGDVLPVLLKMTLGAKEHGEVFNVGPDSGEVTINELASKLMRLMGFSGRAEYHDSRPREVKHAICSSDKIRKRFGFESRKSLDDGLAETVAYYKAAGPKPFQWRLPLEIERGAPKVWKERLQ